MSNSATSRIGILLKPSSLVKTGRTWGASNKICVDLKKNRVRKNWIFEQTSQKFECTSTFVHWNKRGQDWKLIFFTECTVHDSVSAVHNILGVHLRLKWYIFFGSKSTQKEVSRTHIGIMESVLKLKLILFTGLFFYF